MRSYEQVKTIFEENGCKLLDTEYKNSKSKLRYIAQCGHEHEITLDNFRAGKGRLCKECRHKGVANKLKYSYEYIKQVFAKEGCELLSDECKSANKDKLLYIARCGHQNQITFTKFQSGSGRVCNRCSKSIRYDYDTVFDEFQKRGCTLLEDEYINCKTQMKYIATCGHVSTITFDELLNAESVSLKCKQCQKIKHYDIDSVKMIFADNGCELLSTQYRYGAEKLTYIPQCGHKSKISLNKFLCGRGRVCPRCARPRGIKHHAYNPNLTEADRQKRDMVGTYDMKKLRMEAYKRDHFTCQLCGDNRGGNLVAHHLDGWSTDIDKRFELSNLITLCKECHKAFHIEYGYGDNTKDQFDAFARNYANIESLAIN